MSGVCSKCATTRQTSNTKRQVEESDKENWENSHDEMATHRPGNNKALEFQYHKIKNNNKAQSQQQSKNTKTEYKVNAGYDGNLMPFLLIQNTVSKSKNGAAS